MAPTTKSKKRTAGTQDPASQRAKKTTKTKHTEDAPTANAPSSNLEAVPELNNNSNKENAAVATRARPVRSNAGQNGQRSQLEKACNRIRPDLDPNNAQKKRAGNKSFPVQAPENVLAPPAPQPRRRNTQKALVSNLQNGEANDGPQFRLPEKPDQPLLGPSMPSLQLNTPGSLYGFSPFADNGTASGPQTVLEPQRRTTTELRHSDENPPALHTITAPRSSQTAYNFDFSSTLNQKHPGTSNNITTSNFQSNRRLQQEFTQNNHNNFNNYDNHNDFNNYDNHDNYANYDYSRGFFNFGSMLTNNNHINSRTTQQNPLVNHDLKLQPDVSMANFDGNCIGHTSGDGGQNELANNNHSGDEENDDDADIDDQDNDGNGDDEHRDEEEIGNDGLQIDEASPSEDEAAALDVLHNVGSPTAQKNFTSQVPANRPHHGHEWEEEDSDVEDVLTTHRKRNRAVKPPSFGHLSLAASLQMGNCGLFLLDASDNEDKDTSAEDKNVSADDDLEAVPKQRAKRNSKKKKTNTDAVNLKFYSPEWASVLVQAQQRWQRHLILGRDDPFPEREHHLEEANTILTNVIAESLHEGQLLDDTYSHTREMDVCVFAEHSTWRLELKNVAVPIVASKYAEHLDPPEECANQNHAFEMVKQQVSELLEDSSFHINGRDEQNRTNNIAHPAIPKIINDFFYSGPNCLASLFPDDFSRSVPERAIALVMTVIQNCLEEWNVDGYQRSTIPLRGATYRPVFLSLMTAIDTIKGDPYHGAKFEANRAKWARLGMANLQRNKQALQPHQVKVILD